ncbi:MAG: ribosome-associated translation inhibitor RaiA [Burkholderia sp.]
MNLKISGHHLEVTPAIREHMITKLDRVLGHSGQVIDGTVILSVDNHKKKEKGQAAACENQPAPERQEKDFRRKSINGDLYATIDLLIDKLDQPGGQAHGTSAAARTRSNQASAIGTDAAMNPAPRAPAKLPVLTGGFYSDRAWRRARTRSPTPHHANARAL